MKKLLLISFSLLMTACSEFTNPLDIEWPKQLTNAFQGEDERPDIVECLKEEGDIVKDKETGKMRCRTVAGELLELRDLH